MICVPNFWIRFAMFGLSGVSQIKNTVSYVWLSECTSNLYKAQAFTVINVFDALPISITCLYFLFVSKNWMPLSLFFCILCYISLIVSFACPESPRWHLVKGNSKKAIDALNQIARINQTRVRIPKNAIFVEDPNNISKG